MREVCTGLQLKKKRDFCEEFEFYFSVTKSDPNLENLQQLHCDEFQSFSYGNDSKLIQFSALICVERQSFIMVQPYGYEVRRVLLERGDALFMRTDVPHAGVENLTDNANYRIHAFINVPEWEATFKDGYHIKKVTGQTIMPMKWNSKESKFKLSEGNR